MEKKFSSSWKGSKQPRKQRKYLANAPTHIKRKMVSSNLSKELKKKYGLRSIPLKKGDIVKIMRGKFKGKSGKVLTVKTKLQKIEIEGIQIKKKDGSMVNVPLRPSNLQITELNLEGGKRYKALNKGVESKKLDESEKTSKKSKPKEEENAPKKT